MYYKMEQSEIRRHFRPSPAPIPSFPFRNAGAGVYEQRKTHVLDTGVKNKAG